MAYATDYTLEEQIVSRLAKVFDPKDRILGESVTHCGRAALALAKRLYAPELALVVLCHRTSIILNRDTLHLSPHTIPAEDIEGEIPERDIFFLINQGMWHIFMGPAQLDQYGNANISLIGDKFKPTVAFPGSIGLPDNTTNQKRVVWLVNTHTKRVFVPRVDFISGVGHIELRRNGVIKYGAPVLVTSNLGCFDFEPASGRMRVQSLHRGVALEQVVQNTGFELVVPASVPPTDPPTEEEVRLLREEIDPLGVCRLDFAQGVEAARISAEITQREAALAR
ncbi:MAG: hypothetical protein HYY01_13075 [Chloroflexi bacterium]|nr:hypothetical protein [Chloroflexota bacterium]